MDPRAFIFISEIIKATIYQNRQQVLVLFLNQCLSCFMSSRINKKIGGLFHHVNVSSEYPDWRINISMLPNWALCCCIPSSFTKFFVVMGTFLVYRYNFLSFLECHLLTNIELHLLFSHIKKKINIIHINNKHISIKISITISYFL